jgi:response regulator NasT
MAYFKRSRELNSRLIEAEQQLTARQTIDAAKRLLMTNDNLSEPSAHRFLQRRAMDQQKKLVEVAAEFLRSHSQKNGRP